MTNKKRGRKKNWLTFEEARLLIHDESLCSVANYHKWWDRNRPQQIPKYPYNVYKKEWTSWNDFLDNDNNFDDVKRSFRPFVEGVTYAHGLRLKSMQAWHKHIRDNGIPTDVPSHPELYYNTWVSWPHWLGNTISSRVNAQQDHVRDGGLLYIIQQKGRPANVFTIGVEMGGASAIRDAQMKMRFTIIRVFKLEQDYDWKSIVLQNGKLWWENDKEYIIDNVNQLIFDLSSDLI